MSQPRKSPRRRRRAGRSNRADRANRSPGPDRSDRSGGTSASRKCVAREGRRDPLPELRELAPFSVFCALHLWITDTDGFREQSPDAVARHFELTRDELDAYVEEHALTCDALRGAEFDVESARLDMEVAPEGISRVELARTLFEELRETREGDR